MPPTHKKNIAGQVLGGLFLTVVAIEVATDIRKRGLVAISELVEAYKQGYVSSVPVKSNPVKPRIIIETLPITEDADFEILSSAVKTTTASTGDSS